VGIYLSSNLFTHLKWTPIFEWCVVRYGSKNGHQKDMCCKEIGLCSKFVNYSRRSSQNNDHSMRKIIFTLMMNKIFM